MALAYMWRGLIKGRNPNPPDYDVRSRSVQYVPQVVVKQANQSGTAKAMNRFLDTGRRRR